VVAAGETKRDQIVHAQKLLEILSCDVLGVILNKRTHPIPKFIYKHL
jgi:Mrp family chromosome partitioning ATPase